jgi:hypothetical protein
MATTISITLPAAAIREALALADASFRRGKRRGSDESTPSTPRSKKLGRLGEIACAAVLVANTVAAAENFRDASRENEADIVAGSWRLEVRTWSAKFWPSAGRCVPLRQIRHVRNKADCLVWCTVEGRIDAGHVLIRGWSTVEEVARTAPCIIAVGPRTFLNHQVAESDVRDFAVLVDSIRRGAPNAQPP